MKNLSLILLSTLAASQPAKATPVSFRGFYVGGQLGWTQRHDMTSLPLIQETLSTAVVTNNAFRKTLKTNGLTYGFYTGYGQNNNGFYWGGEFSIEDSTANRRTTYAQEPILVSVGTTTPGSFTLDSKYERGVVFGMTPRMGLVIAHENLVYAKLGLEFSRDKGKLGNTNLIFSGATVADAASYNRSKTQFVFVPGLGYERAFGNLLARVEYGYNAGARIKVNNSVVKYTAHVVKFGLAWRV